MSIFNRAPKRLRKLFDFYNEVGEKYPAYEISRRSSVNIARERFVKGLLKLNPHALTLDVGCGPGTFRKCIKHYVGLDASRPYLKKFKGSRVWGIAQLLPFKKNVFDTILLSEVLEHIWERKHVLDECYRVLKQTGYFILSVPSGKHPWQIQKKWDSLGKYGVTYRPYIHGHFTYVYTRKILKRSKFLPIGHRVLFYEGRPRFLVVLALKRRNR